MNADQIAQQVADQVREIVAQAEAHAAQIVRDAEAEADRIRGAAERESESSMQTVRAALDELQTKLGARQAPAAEVEPGPVTVPEPEPPAIPEPSPEPIPEPEPEPMPEPAPPPDEATPPQAAGFDRVIAAAAGRSGDAAAARLVAMNMALDGASREQIEAHLAEEYALDDAGAIVDDVLALAAK
jgi:outer membrane biosynthesis protein TonB